LCEPIVIVSNGKRHVVHWIDAKGFPLINFSFILGKLNKQAKKYNSKFGSGAMIFGGGYDSSIKIPDTLLLDGSFIWDSPAFKSIKDSDK
jgi:hypothetical protein